MKKFLLVIGVIIFTCIQAFSEKNGVYMEKQSYSHGYQSTNRKRIPVRLPIEVFYDDETHQVEVVGDEDVTAQVFLCDQSGNALGYSPCINTVLDVPYDHNGILIIRVENEEWIATGKITL